MGYCDPSWVSDYTWNGLYDRISELAQLYPPVAQDPRTAQLPDFPHLSDRRRHELDQIIGCSVGPNLTVDLALSARSVKLQPPHCPPLQRPYAQSELKLHFWANGSGDSLTTVIGSVTCARETVA